MNNTCPNCGAKDRGYSIASWTCGSRKDFQTGKFIKSKECASAKRAARIAELERQLEEYTESLANVRPSAEADSEEVARLMVENRKLERQLAEAKADNENLNRMLRGTGYGQGAIDAYVSQCEELDRVTAELEQEVASYAAMKDGVAVRIADRESQLAAVTAENAALTKQWNDLDLRTENRHREWSAKLAEVTAERDRLKALIAKYTGKNEKGRWLSSPYLKGDELDAAMQANTEGE